MAMGLDVAAIDAINLLCLTLLTQTFQKKDGETLKDRLEEKSDDYIKQILQSKNKPNSKKHLNLEKQERKKFQNQVKKNLDIYHFLN